MDFDFGDILTRAWKITWKNKVLWIISALPFLTMFLLLPFWLILLFQKNVDFNAISTWMENPIYRTIAILLYLVIIALSVFLQILSRSSLTLGIYRAEAILQPLTFFDLLREGFLRYCWRILGVSLLVAVGTMVVFLAFFVLLAALSVVTMGFAMLCVQPLFILMIPLFLLVMAVTEQSESAIIADELKVMDALRRAYELIKSNIWKYALITLIVYFGMNILISMVTFPLMIPMFFFMMRSMQAGLDFNTMIRMQAVFGVVILPLMALLQGFSLTYMKSAMMLTYLRLTRPAPSLPLLPGTVEAPA
jgi:hypothetical protein